MDPRVYFPPMTNPTVPMYGDQSPMAGMPQPKSEFSPVPGQQVDPTAAQQTVGDTEKSPELQPGNRKSIKEYLSDIRRLREQQRAMGVPEDQLPVPTFTNIQGGELDKSQGMLQEGPGEMGSREVRSYVNPEWKSPGEMGTPTEMGSAHPIQQQLDRMKQASPAIQKLRGVLNNEMHPQWAMAVAFDTIDDWMKSYYDQTGRYPTTEQVNETLGKLRNQAFKDQGEYISKQKKQWPEADMQALFKAHESGNWGYAADAGQNMLSAERIGKVADDAQKAWNKAEEKNMRPIDQDSGEYFNSSSEYIEYKVKSYQETVQNLLSVMSEMGKSEPQADQKAQKGSTDGPQKDYNPPADGGNLPANTGMQLPPEAMSQLQPGMVTTFGNGQRWTIDQNGQPKRVG